MYKILIKNIRNKGFYNFYEKEVEVETDVEGVTTKEKKVYETDSIVDLEAELIELYKTNPTDNVIAVKDVESELDIKFIGED